MGHNHYFLQNLYSLNVLLIKKALAFNLYEKQIIRSKNKRKKSVVLDNDIGCSNYFTSKPLGFSQITKRILVVNRHYKKIRLFIRSKYISKQNNRFISNLIFKFSSYKEYFRNFNENYKIEFFQKNLDNKEKAIPSLIVFSAVKGGFTAGCGDVLGFLPGSHMKILVEQNFKKLFSNDKKSIGGFIKKILMFNSLDNYLRLRPIRFQFKYLTVKMFYNSFRKKFDFNVVFLAFKPYKKKKKMTELGLENRIKANDSRNELKKNYNEKKKFYKKKNKRLYRKEIDKK